MSEAGPDTGARLAELLAKAEIRELVLLYSRGVDRKDVELLRSLYTSNGTDTHGSLFDGDAQQYVDFLERSFPSITIGAHYVCNHLIAVDGDEAEGEVYALGYHVLPDGDGGVVESFVGVRYLDHYRVEDGRWRFASRRVVFDLESTRPMDRAATPPPDPAGDASYEILRLPLFARAIDGAS